MWWVGEQKRLNTTDLVHVVVVIYGSSSSNSMYYNNSVYRWAKKCGVYISSVNNY
jgi:hypothetical protein